MKIVLFGHRQGLYLRSHRNSGNKFVFISRIPLWSTKTGGQDTKSKGKGGCRFIWWSTKMTEAWLVFIPNYFYYNPKMENLPALYRSRIYWHPSRRTRYTTDFTWRSVASTLHQQQHSQHTRFTLQSTDLARCCLNIGVMMGSLLYRNVYLHKKQKATKEILEYCLDSATIYW